MTFKFKTQSFLKVFFTHMTSILSQPEFFSTIRKSEMFSLVNLIVEGHKQRM